MKKLSCLLAMLAGLAVLGVPVSASADYENADFILSDEIRQELANVLDVEVALNGEPKEIISAFTPEEEEEIGVPDFSIETYDLDSAMEVYGFSTVELLDSEYLSKNSDTEPTYHVPFANGRSAGEVLVRRNEETGRLKFQSISIPFGDNSSIKFDSQAVKEKIANIEDVSNLRIYHDGMEDFWIVDFMSQGKEYMIPYYNEFYFEGWNTYIEQGEIYTPDEITKWLDYNIEPKNENDGEITFGENSLFTVREHPPLVAFASLWVGVGSAVVAIGAGTALFRRKKKNNG